MDWNGAPASIAGKSIQTAAIVLFVFLAWKGGIAATIAASFFLRTNQITRVALPVWS
jgi:hypothetical protein